MSYHYHIYHRLTKAAGEYRFLVHAPNPVQALTEFHQKIQLKDGRKPEDYTVTHITQLYPSLGNGMKPDFVHMVESEVDIPHGPNPDLRKPEVVPPEQTKFPFDT